MTTFDGTSWVDSQETVATGTPPETEKTGQQVVKAEEAAKALVSRMKVSPQMWGEAVQFSKMLAYCRPHMSRTEGRFIRDYMKPIGVKYDKRGNMYKQIGDSPVLWSCHIDTVHAKKGFQKIEYWVDQQSGDTFFGVAQGEKSSCLGADDTAGIWLMLEMIRNNVPGLYIFHRAEEIGGVGSKWIAKNNLKALKDIRFAIAFDRRDTNSVITYQRGTRCCSDEFANSLAYQLDMDHRCDETGSFTDTASYVDHIAECTNISVGYYNAHSKMEKVNVDYLFRLRDAICKVDIGALVEKRKPGENTRKWSNHTTYSSYDRDIWDYADYWSKSHGEKDKPKDALTHWELRQKFPKGYNEWGDKYRYDVHTGYYLPIQKVVKIAPEARQYSSYEEAVRLIKDNPEIIADLLEGQGFGSLELKDYILLAGGVAQTN